MRMFVAAVAVFLLPIVSFAGDWNKLATLRSGDRIRIDYSEGKKRQFAKAEFLTWTEDSIAVRIDKGDIVLARNDIRRVARCAGKSRVKGAAVGALTGGAIGLVATVVAARGGGNSMVPLGPVVFAGAAAFAGVGAALGVAIGGTKTELVYQQ
jgi:hypothetical protein